MPGVLPSLVHYKLEWKSWPARESLCSGSGAEPIWWPEKGGVSRGTKGCHLEFIFRERGTLITGCHCQLPPGFHQPRAAPILQTQSSASCRGRTGRRLWQTFFAKAPANVYLADMVIDLSLCCRCIMCMYINTTIEKINGINWMNDPS